MRPASGHRRIGVAVGHFQDRVSAPDAHRAATSAPWCFGHPPIAADPEEHQVARVRAKGSEDFWETHAHASRIAISCAPADCPPVTGRPFDRHRAVVGGVRCHM